jgi:hypothetical protein
MRQCPSCEAKIVFGGKAVGDVIYCDSECLAYHDVIAVAMAIPDDLVDRRAQEVFSSPCPLCKRSRGPVEFHVSRYIFSFIFTFTQVSKQISCRVCGIKKALGGLLVTSLCGWWGYPGIVMTPVFILFNVGKLFVGDPLYPSKSLKKEIRLEFALLEMDRTAKQFSDKSATSAVCPKCGTKNRKCWYCSGKPADFSFGEQTTDARLSSNRHA